MEEQNHDPTVESAPLRATRLVTMEVPDQFSEVLPKHIIVTDPNKSIILRAMLSGLSQSGYITDGGADHTWSSRDLDKQETSPRNRRIRSPRSRPGGP